MQDWIGLSIQAFLNKTEFMVISMKIGLVTMKLWIVPMNSWVVAMNSWVLPIISWLGFSKKAEF